MKGTETFASAESVDESADAPTREQVTAAAPDVETPGADYGVLEDSLIDVSIEPAEPADGVQAFRADTQDRLEQLRAATQSEPGYAETGPVDLFRVSIAGIARNLKHEALASHDIEEVHDINRRLRALRELLAELPDDPGSDSEMARRFRQGIRPDRRVADAALLARLEGILAD